MTSSMLAGERRWATARRGSMTVLGKVAVPKPLNLPSQRLENHGLDPNVEIVPKGTLSWGSQSSSSTTNAWGNSTLLTKTDGGASSPSHLSGRPSSGSGTRPSTAGSDKTHETTNAWSQNSRPSSASGALTSNQTALTSLRPRSAETRPGSSQLSRFAGTASDNSAAWGPGNVSEKLGVASCRSDGFSLSSGDFPTLGSERDNSGRNADPQEHGSYGRPVSSSGRAASEKEKGDISVNTNIKSGTVGGWRRDGPQHVEDVPQTTVEKLHGDPPPHLNANVPPQHFDAWHGPPVNAHPGVWYRGPPGGPPPYGTPLAPGGFPIEPFPYFRPQVPPGALANSQPVPPPGIGPRGHHPTTGDLYRPHIPDAYIRPGMPIRPGFYPGPMPYEGYYGPPMGYFNSSERDVPFMGMSAGPSVYNRHAGENAPDPANNHVRASVHGPMVKTTVPDQAETAAPDENRRPYKVLLKHHNHSDEKLAENKWEHVAANVPHLEKGDQPRTSLHKSEWGLEESKDEVVYSGSGTFSEDACSRNFANQGTSSDLKDKLTANRGKGNAVSESSVNRSENIVPTSAGVPQVYPATPKDTTLLQKIEGLNAKARASDGRPGAVSIADIEEQKDRLQLVDAMSSCSSNEMVTGGLCSEKSQATSHEVDFSAEDTSLRPAASSGTAISRQSSHGAQGRFNHRGKRFNTRDGDGWRKKPLATEPVSEVSAASSEPSPSVHVCGHLTSVGGGVEKSGYNLQGSDEKESLTTVFDANDSQRAKMREIAKQRAEQLQKEEEERTREQMAKAFAKLEELNRRKPAVDSLSPKLEKALPTNPIQQEQEGSQIPPEPVIVAGKSGAPALISNPNAQIIESSASVGEFTALSNNIPLDSSGNVHPEPVVSLDQPPSLPQDARTAGAADSKAGSQVSEGNVSRHKRLGYKQKQNVPSGKNLTDKPVPVNPAEALKDQNDVAANDIASTKVVDNEVVPRSVPSLPVNSNIIAESSAHQRRKTNRNSKTKQKLDDGLKETNAAKVSTESGKPVSSEFELDPCALQSRMTAEHAVQPSGQRTCSPSEETSSRVHNQWKPQQSRRMPRNQQANNRAAERSHISEAVVWAPVRSQNKTEPTNEASDKTSLDNMSLTVKGDSVGQNSMKSKRAEMERYVPKPVAKEMAQQGNVQQQLQSWVNQNLSDDTVGRAEPIQNVENLQPSNSAIGNIGFTSDSRNGDSKLNKPLKAHGSWRQRGSVELASVQGLQDGSSSTSNPSKNVQKSTEQSQSTNLDTTSLKEQPKSSDDWNNSLGWNTLENSETAAHAATFAGKDQGGMGRGKRHPFKGHRSMGNNNDTDNRIANNESGNQDKYSYQPPASEVGQTDKSFGAKDNRGAGERTSHWQPKSQFHSVHNQRGNRPSGGRNATTEVNDAATKDSPCQDGIHLPAQKNKESRENVVQPPTDQPLSKEKSVAEAPNLGHHESRRERKATTFRGRPNSPNLTSINTVEPAPPLPNVDTKHERPISAGFNKSGNQNNRSARGGPESRGDWSSAGQDNRQHTTSSNRERQKNSSSHYQPVGQYNNSNKSGNFEGPPADGFHNRGSRYRERNQSHSRQGGAANFYARQNGGSQL
ncbi:protein MODIFIER OF SNC1 1 isoform X2 [Diospyros lotus]|uniref:protein MODIFIER OF SNC1 1 isoform X2 n=1 Tax=Diospyros lotus TaxID=55363 RepID=UPI0022578D97|nr:protein MODIFIER OF SNC1 1 isoform X2 [Diospyros lotus]